MWFAAGRTRFARCETASSIPVARNNQHLAISEWHSYKKLMSLSLSKEGKSVLGIAFDLLGGSKGDGVEVYVEKTKCIFLSPR